MPTDFSNQRFGKLAVTRDRGTMPLGRVLENRMAAAFADEATAVSHQMLKEVPTFHGVAATLRVNC